MVRAAPVYREARASKRFSVGIGGALLSALSAGCLAITACEDEYPLAPSFCDDWCRATLRADCEEEPDNCVRDCELTKPSDACSERQRELLTCYEGLQDSAFVCVGIGFQSEPRVEPESCRAERDALYECESPGIGLCLGFCRGIQQDQLGKVLDAETGLVDYSKLLEDAGVSADAGGALTCPAIDQPCEDLCWSVYGFGSQALLAAGVPPSAAVGGLGSQSTDAGQGVSTAIECVQSALLACLSDGQPGLVGGGTPSVLDAGAPRVRSIGDVIDECVESELADQL